MGMPFLLFLAALLALPSLCPLSRANSYPDEISELAVGFRRVRKSTGLDPGELQLPTDIALDVANGEMHWTDVENASNLGAHH